MKRRVAALWLVLFALYASTLGLDAFAGSDYGGDEPRYLLIADSIVEDGDLDLLDDYREREYDEFHLRRLEPEGGLRNGRLHEPQGAGFPLLIAPAFAVGGARGVELFLAALAALAAALMYPLARRAAPDPWALGATLAIALSPPLVAYSTAVYPELAAAAALAAAALLALRLEERPSRPGTFACLVLLATLPWLGIKIVPAGIVVGYFAIRALRRHHRGLLALVGAELAGFSAILYVSVNGALYGGPTPYSADAPAGPATGAEFPFGYADRLYRLGALLVDREYGLLRWAPVFALVLAGAWLLYRAHRERLSTALPAHREVERAATLCGLVLAAQVLVAAFLAPTMYGSWFPGRHLVAGLPFAAPLVAWGLRHAPRPGAILAILAVAASVWLYVDVRVGAGALAADRPDAPWGPLEVLFPVFDDSVLPYALAAAVAVTALALAVVEDRRFRKVAEAGGGGSRA